MSGVYLVFGYIRSNTAVLQSTEQKWRLTRREGEALWRSRTGGFYRQEGGGEERQLWPCPEMPPTEHCDVGFSRRCKIPDPLWLVRASNLVV